VGRRPVLLTSVVRAGLFAAAVGTLGCYESTFPIDASPQADVDQALLGVWRCVADQADASENAATITVTQTADRLYAVTFQEDAKTPDHYEAHASVVGGQRLLNTRDLSGGSKPWVFMRYSLLRPSVLQLDILNGDALEEQSSPADLRRAVQGLEANDKAYVEFCTCARARRKQE
jgi:hypothetical protein